MVTPFDRPPEERHMLEITVEERAWPLLRPFTISRGTRDVARTVIVTLSDGKGRTGTGEAVPYPRYGEAVEDTVAELEAAAPSIASGISHDDIPRLLSGKAARNALDCALWDLEAAQTEKPVWKLAGLPRPAPLVTAYTISLGSPEDMADQARHNAGRPLLKLKLGADAAGDIMRLRAVRMAAPHSRIIVDANEGWQPDSLPTLFAVCADCGVELIEQPLPADADEALSRIIRPVPVCADESVHDIEDLPALRSRYDAVNIKLDKTGGLTPALRLASTAREQDFEIMVGCMLASSLAMAPAFLVAQLARWTDLDGPLLLAEDFAPSMQHENSVIQPPEPALWG